MAYLSLKNVTKEYHSGEVTIKALSGVNLEIEEGELCVIVGPSGAGKTTLLNILGGMDCCTGGEVVLDGEHIEKMKTESLANIRCRKLGFVFQSYNLLSRTSAIENVELPLLYNSKIAAEERRERAFNALKRVGLESRMNHLPNQLSGGQQQRVAIARALVNDPVIILADEATGNLDTRTSYEIMEIFQELHSRGKTIVFVTHEPDIATFSTRTIVLRDGQIRRDSPNENVQSAKAAFEALPPAETFEETESL